MLKLVHTAECIAANAEYFEQNPNACRVCNGTGKWSAAPAAVITRDELVETLVDGKKTTRRILEVGDGAPCIVNSCDACFGRYDKSIINPVCPRCQKPNYNWSRSAHKHDPCSACGWTLDDPATSAPAAGCNCSEFQKDNVALPGVGKVYG